MAILRYESSVDALCEQLDALMRGIVAEVELHQQRVEMLRQQSESVDSETEVRGAVMASAITLLDAVAGVEGQLTEVRDIIQQQQSLLASLHEESRTDVLTGLLNRRAFDEEFARRAAQAQRSGAPLGLLIIDIDRFKRVNDTYGHAAGDKVLRGVANLLSNALREMDLVARFGGEEFVAILPDANLLNACRAAERARVAVGASFIQFEDHELGVTISAGVALVENDLEDALRQADDALYAAKRAGRNRVFVFKDGYCQPLEQEATAGQGAQRRRWLRFLVEDSSVRVRADDGPWRQAQVQDESLTGIGLLLTEDVGLANGDVVEIDYLGDCRRGVVMNLRPHEENSAGVRVGVEWVST